MTQHRALFAHRTGGRVRDAHDRVHLVGFGKIKPTQQSNVLYQRWNNGAWGNLLRIGADELTQFLSGHKRIMHAIMTDMAERIETTSARLLRSETNLVELRATLADVADRLARGDIDTATAIALLKGLAIDDLTLG